MPWWFNRVLRYRLRVERGEAEGLMGEGCQASRTFTAKNFFFLERRAGKELGLRLAADRAELGPLQVVRGVMRPELGSCHCSHSSNI